MLSIFVAVRTWRALLGQDIGEGLRRVLPRVQHAGHLVVAVVGDVESFRVTDVDLGGEVVDASGVRVDGSLERVGRFG